KIPIPATVAMRIDHRMEGLPRWGDHVAAAARVFLQSQDAVSLRIPEELGEGAEAVVLLVELGVLALDRLLDHGAPDHFLVLAQERLERVEDPLEVLFLLL